MACYSNMLPHQDLFPTTGNAREPSVSHLHLSKMWDPSESGTLWNPWMCRWHTGVCSKFCSEHSWEGLSAQDEDRKTYCNCIRHYSAHPLAFCVHAAPVLPLSHKYWDNIGQSAHDLTHFHPILCADSSYSVKLLLFRTAHLCEIRV